MCRVGGCYKAGRVVLGGYQVIFCVGMLGVVVICLSVVVLVFVACDVLVFVRICGCLGLLRLVFCFAVSFGCVGELYVSVFA